MCTKSMYLHNFFYFIFCPCSQLSSSSVVCRGCSRSLSEWTKTVCICRMQMTLDDIAPAVIPCLHGMTAGQMLIVTHSISHSLLLNSTWQTNSVHLCSTDVLSQPMELLTVFHHYLVHYHTNRLQPTVYSLWPLWSKSESESGINIYQYL